MNIGLFIIGAVVTAMVVGALLLLVYGAILDGHEVERLEQSTRPSDDGRRDGRPQPGHTVSVR
jgi:hypothetical protein